MNDDEKKLRILFDELRAVDAASAPRFDARLRTTQENRARHGWTLRVIAVAMILAVFVGVFAVRRARHVADAAPSITQWRSPTESLLRRPPDPLLTSMPTAHYDIQIRTEN